MPKRFSLPSKNTTLHEIASSRHAVMPNMAGKLLRRDFYLDDAPKVARQLLGKLLYRKLGSQTLIGRIVEVEAYIGAADEAAHTFSGPTARNQVLFGPPGHAYVYFIYGMYYCLNISCEPEGQAGCVLIRALEPVSGFEEMARLRKLAPDADPRLLTSGPGKLCQAFGIVRGDHNGVDLTLASSELQVREDSYIPAEIQVTPRVGIRKAVDFPLRFLIAGNRFVSRG